MSTTAQLSGILRGILIQPTRGIVGLVDELLIACLENGIQIDWQTDHFRFRPTGGDWEELTDIAIPQSVFRAILARLFTLCNEQFPNTVTPYKGLSELSVGESPRAVLRIAFVNTPATQKLELNALGEMANGV